MDCSKCVNETICMFKDDAQELKQQIADMDGQMRVNCPININLTCRRYQSNQAKCERSNILQQMQLPNRPGIYYRD